MKKNKILAMIPARIGSERLKFKNLALIDKKPLIYYAINAAKKSRVFQKIILNSDEAIFKKIAKRYKINFYLRPKLIGHSNTKSDDVVYDFIMNNPGFDIVAWVNPVSPLIEGLDIKSVLNYFQKKKLDSLITSEDKRVHSTYKYKPINFKKHGKFAKTQDLEPVKVFTYHLMIWKVKKFITEYKKKKSAIICGKFSNYSLANNKSIIVKNINDLKLAELILRSRRVKFKKTNYDKVLKLYKKSN